METKISHYKYLALVLILICAAVLRLHALSFGIGQHPDERHMVFVTQNLSLKDMNPHSFAYGSLPYYLNWGASHALGVFSSFFRSYDGLFLSGRIVCVLFGLLGVLLTYLSAKEVFKSELTALAAAALLALNFFHIQLSRYFTSDVILSTLCLLSLYGIIRLLNTGSLAAALLAGAALGAALATKISAVLLAPLLCFAAAVLIWRNRDAAGKSIGRISLLLLLSLAAAGLTAFVLQPYAVLDYHTFSLHVREQTNMVRGIWRPPYTVQYAGTLPFVYHLQQMFFYTMSPPLALAAAAGIVFSAWQMLRRPGALEFILLGWILLFFLATAGWQVKFPRYLLPVYPPLFILAARALCLAVKPLTIERPPAVKEAGAAESFHCL